MLPLLMYSVLATAATPVCVGAAAAPGTNGANGASFWFNGVAGEQLYKTKFDVQLHHCRCRDRFACISSAPPKQTYIVKIGWPIPKHFSVSMVLLRCFMRSDSKSNLHVRQVLFRSTS